MDPSPYEDNYLVHLCFHYVEKYFSSPPATFYSLAQITRVFYFFIFKSFCSERRKPSLPPPSISVWWKMVPESWGEKAWNRDIWGMWERPWLGKGWGAKWEGGESWPINPADKYFIRDGLKLAWAPEAVSNPVRSRRVQSISRLMETDFSIRTTSSVRVSLYLHVHVHSVWPKAWWLSILGSLFPYEKGWYWQLGAPLLCASRGDLRPWRASMKHEAMPSTELWRDFLLEKLHWSPMTIWVFVWLFSWSPCTLCRNENISSWEAPLEMEKAITYMGAGDSSCTLVWK